MRGRRSRSQCRARENSSAAPSEVDDDDFASLAVPGAGGASGDKGKRRRPLGGVLGSKLLRRSQTTGDMDAPQPKARVSARQEGNARYHR